MNYHFLGTVLTISLLSAVPGGAFPSWESLQNQVKRVPLNLPEKNEFNLIGKSGTAKLTIQRTYHSAGDFEVQSCFKDTVIVQKFNRYGQLIFSQQTAKGGKVMNLAISANRKTAQFLVTNQNTVMGNRTINLDGNTLLFPEIQHAVIQVWQSGEHHGFNFQSFSPDGAYGAGFEVKFLVTKNPLGLTDKYDYPQDFKNAFKNEAYVVADMYVVGPGSFFYPHHFYFVFQNHGSRIDFLAYWGDDPNHGSYQYRIN